MYLKENYMFLNEIEENIDKIRIRYEQYKKYNEEIELIDEYIDEFLSHNEYLVHILNKLKKESREKHIAYEDNTYIQKFLEEHQEVKYYCEALYDRDNYLELAKEQYDFLHNDYAEYALLIDKEKKFFLDLDEKEMIDVSNFEKDFLDFILKGIRTNSYLLEITPNDLPLLMAIKEEIDYSAEDDLKFDENDLEFDEDDAIIMEEKFYDAMIIKHQFYLEFFRTKMVEERITEKDNIRTTLPFIYDSNIQIKMWNDLDARKVMLTEDEYWIEYYKLLMIFDNDIEKLYEEAPADKKGCVIDAYCYYSEVADHHEHFRTSSPLINIEVLKRKYMGKQKVKTKNKDN